MTYILEMCEETRREILDALNSKDARLEIERVKVQQAYKDVFRAPEKVDRPRD